MEQATGTPSRQAISDAVTGVGWRYVLDSLQTCVRVGSPAHAAQVASHVVAAGDGRLWLDLRPDRLVLTVGSSGARLTAADVELARRLSSVVSGLGLTTDAEVGAAGPRSVQVLEVAIDAIDIASVRPFWKAVLGYDDEGPVPGPESRLVDPLGQGPPVWFQQMDAPRPQRNRIHLDVSVPHDEAPRRVAAAIAAGGELLSDSSAPAFWVLADAEGNEACVSTWQGRD